MIKIISQRLLKYNWTILEHMNICSLMERLVYYPRTINFFVRRDNLTSKAIYLLFGLACYSFGLTSIVFECSLQWCENEKNCYYPGNYYNQSSNKTFRIIFISLIASLNKNMLKDYLQKSLRNQDIQKQKEIVHCDIRNFTYLCGI